MDVRVCEVSVWLDEAKRSEKCMMYYKIKLEALTSTDWLIDWSSENFIIDWLIDWLTEWSVCEQNAALMASFVTSTISLSTWNKPGAGQKSEGCWALPPVASSLPGLFGIIVSVSSAANTSYGICLIKQGLGLSGPTLLDSEGGNTIGFRCGNRELIDLPGKIQLFCICRRKKRTGLT
jgi:hypothetical protein